MSFRGGNRFPARQASPSQIFKKRNDLLNVDIPINSDATLLGTITLDETGTLYALKVSLFAFGEGGTNSDMQRVTIWARCVPAGTALPDLTTNQEMDTINGFPVKSLAVLGLAVPGPYQAVDTKFRFRRKCDANMLIQLIGQHTNVQGTGRVVNISGLMTAIYRVR